MPNKKIEGYSTFVQEKQDKELHEYSLFNAIFSMSTPLPLPAAANRCGLGCGAFFFCKRAAKV